MDDLSIFTHPRLASLVNIHHRMSNLHLRRKALRIERSNRRYSPPAPPLTFGNYVGVLLASPKRKRIKIFLPAWPCHTRSTWTASPWFSCASPLVPKPVI